MRSRLHPRGLRPPVPAFLRDARRRAVLRFGSAIAMACLAGAACADSTPPQSPPGTNPAPASAEPFGFLSAAWQSQTLLGDMGGLRPLLAKYGVTLSILENVETFGNLTGGVRQGFEVNGLTTATLQVDTQKAFGLNGGLFNVSGLQIWGGDLERDQPPRFADGERHRGARRRSTLGALVSAEVRRQVRHQDRRAEPRRGIRHQPELVHFSQRGVRLADASLGGLAGRRPRLSPRGPGRFARGRSRRTRSPCSRACSTAARSRRIRRTPRRAILTA